MFLPERHIRHAYRNYSPPPIVKILMLTAIFVAASAVAAFALLVLPVAHGNEVKFGDPALSQPFASSLKFITTPWLRWDSLWYLHIAESGYRPDPSRAAFFPLYPLLVRCVAWLMGFQVTVKGLALAALTISAAAYLAAIAFLYKLTAIEANIDAAWRAAVFALVFPMALFFHAGYSESLFLMLAVASFYFGRRRKWLVAAICVGLASLTRSAGVILLLPLLIMFYRDYKRLSPGGKSWLPALWFLLVPLSIGCYVIYLQLEVGDPLAFVHSQGAWFRELTTPFNGLSRGFLAAFDGVRQLFHGSPTLVYWTSAVGDPFSVAYQNIEAFAFLVFAVFATVGIFRLLPLEYGALSASMLLLPLSFPTAPIPLMSLPRFMAVIFPIYIWLGIVLKRRAYFVTVTALFAAGLAFYIARYATWHWVA